jgi:hypothetical protein
MVRFAVGATGSKSNYDFFTVPPGDRFFAGLSIENKKLLSTTASRARESENGSKNKQQ